MTATFDMTGRRVDVPEGQETLERAVFAEMHRQATLQGYGDRLGEQLARARFPKRDLSGAGFFLSIDVPDDAPHLEAPGSPLPVDAYAGFAGDRSSANFLLFMRKPGLIDCLEGFTYDKDWPADVSGWQVTELPVQ